jgi:Ca2+-binding RTX toxin-like protein
VVTGGAGNDWLSGDRGNDTLAGGAGADIFHTFAEAGIDRVTDFNAAEGDRIQLDPGTHYTLSQVGADTVIDMGGGNQMILVGVSMGSLASGTVFGA